MRNLIIKLDPPKRCVLKPPAFITDAHFQEFSVLPYTRQDTKGTIEVLGNIQRQNL